MWGQLDVRLISPEVTHYLTMEDTRRQLRVTGTEVTGRPERPAVSPSWWMS